MGKTYYGTYSTPDSCEVAGAWSHSILWSIARLPLAPRFTRYYGYGRVARAVLAPRQASGPGPEGVRCSLAAWVTRSRTVGERAQMNSPTSDPRPDPWSIYNALHSSRTSPGWFAIGADLRHPLLILTLSLAKWRAVEPVPGPLC